MEIRRKTIGETNPSVAESIGNVGLAQWYQGRLGEAEQSDRKALEMKTAMLPASHSDICASYNNISLVLRDNGNLEEAEKMQRHLLDLLKQNGLPDTHRNMILARNNLAIIFRRRGALSGELAVLHEALQINPTDGLTADAVSALHAKPPIPILSEPQWSAAIWHYTDTPPGPKWFEAGFSEQGWKSSPAPHGLPTYFPRKPNTPITSHADLWLRREFVLSEIPAGKLLLRINRNQDAQVFLNGVQAAPMMDWSDTEVFVPCAASLKRGPNILAVHCQDADGNAPIDVRIFATADPSLGRTKLIEDFSQMILKEPKRAELHAGRAGARARLGLWPDAGADMSAAIGLSSSTPAYWYRYQLAALLLKTENQADYQSRRQTALQLFAKPDGPDVAGLVSRLALLSPAQDDLAAAVKLAGIATEAEYPEGLTWRQVARGLAEYRNGQSKTAIEWMDKALLTAAQKDLPGWSHERERNQTATAWLVQAMSHHQLKKTTEARAAMTKAAGIMDGEFPKEDSGDFGREWADWLFANILRHEAESLMKTSSP